MKRPKPKQINDLKQGRAVHLANLCQAGLEMCTPISHRFLYFIMRRKI